MVILIANRRTKLYAPPLFTIHLYVSPRCTVIRQRVRMKLPGHFSLVLRVDLPYRLFESIRGHSCWLTRKLWTFDTRRQSCWNYGISSFSFVVKCLKLSDVVPCFIEEPISPTSMHSCRSMSKGKVQRTTSRLSIFAIVSREYQTHSKSDYRNYCSLICIVLYNSFLFLSYFLL